MDFKTIDTTTEAGKQALNLIVAEAAGWSACLTEGSPYWEILNPEAETVRILPAKIETHDQAREILASAIAPQYTTDLNAAIDLLAQLPDGRLSHNVSDESWTGERSERWWVNFRDKRGEWNVRRDDDLAIAICKAWLAWKLQSK